MRLNLPNAITALRVALCPVLAALLFEPHMTPRLLAFGVFLVAAVSDLWDGYLARRRGQITDFGKLVDPIADKLLLVVTLVPFYLITRSQPETRGLPLFGGIPLWTLLVLLGREALITGIRVQAARRGRVLAAARSGKRKAVAQNVFIGSMILWMGLRAGAEVAGWSGAVWRGWRAFHGWFVSLSLLLALVLTVYSMLRYLASFSRALRGGEVG